jgi:hypothetical protein
MKSKSGTSPDWGVPAANAKNGTMPAWAPPAAKTKRYARREIIDN